MPDMTNLIPIMMPRDIIEEVGTEGFWSADEKILTRLVKIVEDAYDSIKPKERYVLKHKDHYVQVIDTKSSGGTSDYHIAYLNTDHFPDAELMATAICDFMNSEAIELIPHNEDGGF